MRRGRGQRLAATQGRLGRGVRVRGGLHGPGVGGSHIAGDRPVASAAYSFIRFVGGAAAPFLAGKLAESFVPSVPFYVGGAAVFASIVVPFSGRSYLSKV